MKSKPQIYLFLIEPFDANFLKKRLKTTVFKIPPFEFNFLQLEQMKYFKPKRIKYYDKEYQIVATGNNLYMDIDKKTVSRTLHVVKFIDCDMFFVMSDEKDFLFFK